MFSRIPNCPVSDAHARGAYLKRTTSQLDPSLPRTHAVSGTRNLTRAQKKAAGASPKQPPEGLPEGELKLTIEPDGVAFSIHADGGDEELAFEPSGDRVKVTGGSYCEDPAAEATYRWSRSGQTLTFKPIDNDCPERRAVLVGTWRAKSTADSE